MESPSLSSLSSLPEKQISALRKGDQIHRQSYLRAVYRCVGGIITIADLFLTPVNEITRKCKEISHFEVKGILDSVSKTNCPRIRPLGDALREGDEKLTTGDANLDDALGGGIRTGMVWEVVGERYVPPTPRIGCMLAQLYVSAAGKTQFALQLSLLVQIPPKLGGLKGSCCYLTTSSQLPTSRLVQISESHPLLSPSLCNLADVHTISTPTIPILIHVLCKVLPEFIKSKLQDSSSKPVKLLVIDALAELFHSSNKTTTATLVERSRNISEISTVLHSLASAHGIAILVLNEVIDVFDRGSGTDSCDNSVVAYRDQARWFNRADSIPGENRKEASLGLVWANQVNARIILSRSGRRRHLEEIEPWNTKHRRFDGSARQIPPTPVPSSLVEDPYTLIRRLSIIFNSISAPVSLDYIITLGGISILPNDTPSASNAPAMPPLATTDISTPYPPSSTLDISPLDVGFVEDGREGAEKETGEEDEWETYWKDDDLPEDAYNNIDLNIDMTPGNTVSSVPENAVS